MSASKKLLRIVRVLTFSFALSALLSLAPQAEARTSGGPFGLGILLGEPTAITAKYWIANDRAIDAGLSFNLDKWFLIYGDWHAEFPGAFGRRNQFISDLSPYVGIGGLVVVSNRNEAETRKEKYFSDTSSSKTALGFRIPLGIEWQPNRVPVGVFLELVPGLTIIPGTTGFVQGGLGAIFYF